MTAIDPSKYDNTKDFISFDCFLYKTSYVVFSLLISGYGNPEDDLLGYRICQQWRNLWYESYVSIAILRIV